ncbi:FHA domain-containing protein [Rhodopirellula europaea]|uniref:Protein containing Forkhead-associated domain protein n=1 Tax=Rhodopirellula europaea 6C TaxID=1263867 RepID=M2B6E8_9BACT|nr:FHA domain-containing protein [Rhodopirellula europaea]EMB17318.1 protein containing Forkhead-associated domain protein [Rhodopirellula europaea 6C]
MHNRQNPVTDSSAQLILATGSRAGMVAEIRSGYYMIGRDRVCQIRPKSRSVSRKHCLLHWETPDDSEPRFRVFDLDSSAGTRVNGTRIPTRTWIELVDGAELRCGKIAFGLAIESAEEAARKQAPAIDPREDTVVNERGFDTASGFEDSDAAGQPSQSNSPRAAVAESPTVSLLQGEAWQEVDIASFLEAEDTVAREARYDDIRAKTSNPDSSQSDSEIFDQDEEFIDDDAAESPDQTPSDRGAATNKRGSGSPPSAKVKGAAKTSVLNRVDWDKVKIYAAFAMTIAVFVFGGYQVMQFWQGPEVRIVDGID